MNRFSGFSSGTAAFLALGMTAGAVAPIVISAPATAATFTDIRTHWARPFLEVLAQENLIRAYQNTRFAPNQTVTRTQFITMLRQAFNNNNVNLESEFDIDAAQEALRYTFSNGTSASRQVRSTDKLTKAQVLVALAQGLGLESSDSPDDIVDVFRDANSIPEDALEGVAAATENGIVVNYPNARTLTPQKIVTRGEVATFIYQALATQGAIDPIASRSAAYKYIVQATSDDDQANNDDDNTSSTNANYKVSRNTRIDVEYENANQVIIAPGDTLDLTLRVAEDIENSRGQVLIPEGSEIEGQLVSRYRGNQFIGAQFVGERITIGNRSYRINATSSVVNAQRSANVNQDTVRDAAVTAAAQVLIGRATGQRIDPISILGSVLRGGTAGTQQRDDVVVVNERDLRLTVASDLYVSRTSSSQR